MENEALRQLENTVEIVGTLKSKNLEVKTSKKGNKYISGDLVVVSKFDNKVQEHKVRVFVMESSKLYKGVETVKNEYKTIEDDGEENADRIKVTGELTLNEYYNSQGNLVQFNQIRGIFFTRLKESDDTKDKAIAVIETVVEGFTQELDKENLPTGNYYVQAFTVGYGNEVIELKNVIVGKDLAQSFMDLYQPGSTGKLTFKLNNYVELEKQQQESAAVQHGFGVTETIETNITKYVNNIEVIGGSIPYFGTKEYTPEEIERAKKLRQIKLQELSQPAPETPTGFGITSVDDNEDIKNTVENNMPTGMADFDFEDDMPDF
jgi:hypothetical protein